MKTRTLIVSLHFILSFSQAFAQNDSLLKIKNKRFFVGLGSGVGFGYSNPHEKREIPYFSFYPEASLEIKLTKRLNLIFYTAFYKLQFYKDFKPSPPHYIISDAKRFIYTFENIDYSIGPNIAISKMQRLYLHPGIGINFLQEGYTITELLFGEIRKVQYKFISNRRLVYSLQLRYLIYQIKHVNINLGIKVRYLPNVSYDFNKFDSNYYEVTRNLSNCVFLLQFNFY